MNMLLLNGMKALEPAYQAQGMTAQEFKAARDLMLELPPIEKAFLFMMQNFIVGFVMSLPIAFACRKGK